MKSAETVAFTSNRYFNVVENECYVVQSNWSGNTFTRATILLQYGNGNGIYIIKATSTGQCDGVANIVGVAHIIVG